MFRTKKYILKEPGYNEFYTNPTDNTHFFDRQKTYVIPRYQRPFSWDRKQVEVFLSDILNQIEINPIKILSKNEYFFGTLLVVGNFDNEIKEIEVVDGQQRITLITILFSALSRLFSVTENGKNFSDQLWKYIINVDNDQEKYSKLINETAYPYFQNTIQTLNSSIPFKIDKGESAEEKLIEQAYTYFVTELSKDKIYSLFSKVTNTSIVGYDYIDILKAIRDQILYSKIICISTDKGIDSNLMFESLNAKGSKLQQVDLVKNRLFGYLKDRVPNDKAKDKWKTIQSNLLSPKKDIDFSTFLIHYWRSKYNWVTEMKIYDEFKSRLREDEYFDFLCSLEKESKTYSNILKPSLDHYNKNNAYLEMVEALDNLSNVFSIKIVRVPLLAMFDVFERKPKNRLIRTPQLVALVKYLEVFHFAYNGVCKKRTNTVDAKYTTFAINLRKMQKKEDVKLCIEKLITQLNTLMPTENEFIENFKKLEYQKNATGNSIKRSQVSRYAIRELEKLECNKKCTPSESSIEHILPEGGKHKKRHNIGNLILLESDLNEECGISDYCDKKEIYVKSQYITVNKFVLKNNTWDGSKIEMRAVELAKKIYKELIEKAMDL